MKTEPKYFQTGTDLRRHLKRTRKTRVRQLCAKYNTQSYAQASYADTADICARMQAKIQLHNLCKKLEQAVIEGDFVTGEKLSYRIQRLKAA
jgi:hypothetical protein